jgi:hypothetical protein
VRASGQGPPSPNLILKKAGMSSIVRLRWGVGTLETPSHHYQIGWGTLFKFSGTVSHSLVNPPKGQLLSKYFQTSILHAQYRHFLPGTPSVTRLISFLQPMNE